MPNGLAGGKQHAGCGFGSYYRHLGKVEGNAGAHSGMETDDNGAISRI
jgi:hypothetical protein